ncbi:MAG TPA: hypothetical protein VN651_03230 [Gemmatimonadaceae bacterium]|nr:hypothetical protein [Gemmatimonadaceae bacterium]
MPSRSIDADGRRWLVYPSGRVTQNDRDEFALVFVAGTGAARKVRVTRYSPVGSRSRERSLLELSDADLQRLFGFSQPSDTSPEVDYSA